MLLRIKILAFLFILSTATAFCGNNLQDNRIDSVAYINKRKQIIATSLSAVIPGTGQLYNKDYWKTPLFYTGLAATGYAVYRTNYIMNGYLEAYNNKIAALSTSNPQWDLYPDYSITELKDKADHFRSLRTYSFVGMGAIYLTNVVDAFARRQKTQSPAAATLMSAILPGSGQLYNKKYWKMPIIYAGFSTLIYVADLNNTKYVKYRDEYEQMLLSQTDPAVTNPYPGVAAEAIQNRRDKWRKYRDLNYIGMGLLYVLNILDANVDANLLDYDVSDNLSMHFAPYISPINKQGTSKTETNIGLSFSISF